MEIINQYHETVAVLIARVFLGLLFFFQGYDAVFNVKIKNVIGTYQVTFANKGIPKVFTTWASWYTSCTALIGGFLLIIGLFEYFTLYLLGINIIIASIGFGINTPVWDTKFVFPRLLLLLLLLMIPESINTFTCDYLFFKR